MSGQYCGWCRLPARLPAILGTVGAQCSGVVGARAGHRPARRALLEGHRCGGQPHDWRGRRWPPLAAHRWPGDVRELQDVLADITVTGPRYGAVGPGSGGGVAETVGPERQPTLAGVRKDLERAMVRDILGHRNVARTTGKMGVTQQGPAKLMTRLRIDRFSPGRDRSAPATSLSLIRQAFKVDVGRPHGATEPAQFASIYIEERSECSVRSVRSEAATMRCVRDGFGDRFARDNWIYRE